MDLCWPNLQETSSAFAKKAHLTGASSSKDLQSGKSGAKYGVPSAFEDCFQPQEDSDWEEASDGSSVVFVEEKRDIRCGLNLEGEGIISAKEEERSLEEEPEEMLYRNGPPPGDELAIEEPEDRAYQGIDHEEVELVLCPDGTVLRRGGSEKEEEEEEEEEVSKDIGYKGGSAFEVKSKMALDSEEETEKGHYWGRAALVEIKTSWKSESSVCKDGSPARRKCSGEEVEESDSLLRHESEEEAAGQWVALPVEKLVAEPHPSKPRHICSECGRSLASHSALVRHCLIHTGELPYACPECGRRFRQSSALVRHLRAHRGERPYACGECGKAFGVRSALVRHQRALHTSERPYVCGECGKAYADLSILTKHQLMHANGRPFSCPDCGQGFGHRTTLAQHRRTHAEERPYRCAECGQTFRQNSALANHRQIHSGTRPFSCQYCGKSFAGRPTLAQHLWTHTGEKLYTCLDCGRRFSTSSNLLQHRQNHLGEHPFACSLCGRRFDRRPDLARHYVTHAEGSLQPHQCAQCGERFAEPADLEKHRSTHQGEPPYVCSSCGKSFNQAASLARHQRSSHLPTTLQAFRHKVCGQPFGQSSDLLLHSRESTCACADCGEALGRSSHLPPPQRGPTHQRPDVSREPGKSSCQSVRLGDHRRRRLGERPYECTDCGRSFGRKGHLDTHRRTQCMMFGAREREAESLVECIDLESLPDL